MDKKLFRTILLIIAVCIALIIVVINIRSVIGGIETVLHLLSPVFIGVCIAFILYNPYMFFMKLLRKALSKPLRRTKSGGAKLAKVLSLIIVYIIFLSVLVLLALLVVPQLTKSISNIASNIDTYVENITAFFAQAETFLGLDISIADEIETKLTVLVQKLPEIISSLIPSLFKVTQSVASSVANAFIGFAMSIYLLSGKEFLTTQVKRFTYAYTPKRIADKACDIMNLTTKTFSGFVSGQLTDALIVGVLCFIGMSIFRFEYAFLISAIIAVTNIIPILGPFIGAIPSAFLLFIVDPKQALFFVIFILVLQQIDGNIICPRIVGDSIGLPSILVLISITVGGGLLGIFGMIIGVPLCAVLYKIIRDEVRRRTVPQE